MKRKDISSIFAANLRRLRKAKGLSLRSLGESAGLSGAYVYQMESGLRSPSLSTVATIADSLGVSASYMLEVYGE